MRSWHVLPTATPSLFTSPTTAKRSTSDTYRRNRPDVAAQVAGALDRPFSADDLSHLLLDLAGIRCRWYDPARSLIGERFDTTRPRPLLMGFEPAGNYETIIGRDRKQ